MADYYKTLGVERGAGDDDIKKSYRKLALKYHPDRNKGDKQAEDKFKEISEAYAVLSDPEKKRQYDTVGDSNFHQRYSQEDIFRNTDFSSIFREFDLGGGESIFSQIFGSAFAGGGGRGFSGFQGGGFEDFGSGAGPRTRGRRGAPQQPGQDIEYPLTIGFLDAFNGGERQISFSLSDGSRRDLKVRIPAGVRSGGKLRIAGQGVASPYGGPAGDLLVVIDVAAHPQYKRDGDDIETHLPLKLSEALLGGTHDVETLDGVKKLKVPAGVRPGTKLRLKGLGFPLPGQAERRGDFYVVIDLSIPRDLTAEQRAAAEALRQAGL